MQSSVPSQPAYDTLEEPSWERRTILAPWNISAPMTGRKRKWLTILLSCTLFVATLETLLRLFADRLPAAIGNEVVRIYSCEQGGMYFRDLLSGFNFTYPNDHRLVLFNGYRWQHQTDERGFRNPAQTECQVMLLGDSVVYGHGVEEPETMAAVLRRDFGWKAYNMARQGDTLNQEYVLWKLYSSDLKPRHVVLCPFGNDFWDINRLRTPPEMLDPPELKPGYVDSLRKRLADPHFRHLEGDWCSWLYSYRLFKVLVRLSQGANWSSLPENYDREEFQRAANCYEKLFQDMATTCRAQGVQLHVLYLDTANQTPHWQRTQLALDQFLRSLCQRHSVPFLSTHQLLLAHPEFTLPGDGHLNALGHRAVAHFLADGFRPRVKQGR